MKTLAFLSAVFAVAALQAYVPELSDVSVSQDGKCVVTIAYSSSAPAIVTLEMFTNNLQLAAECFTNAVGDYNRKVVDAGAHVITWQPRETLPEMKARVQDGGLRVKLTAWATNAPPPYLVASLTEDQPPRFYPSESQLPGGTATNEIYKNTKLLMKRVAAAQVIWRMGSPKAEGSTYRDAREVPHLVKLTKDYYLGVFPVTHTQYVHVVGSHSFAWTAYENFGYFPVTKSYYSGLRGNQTSYNWPTAGHSVVANGPMDLFRQQTHIPLLDLPTEAQWEFAAKAGTGFPYGDGRFDGYISGDDVGWVSSNSSSRPHVVGTKKANLWGFYDMFGNATDWCLDWRTKGVGFLPAGYKPGDVVIDPVGPDAADDTGVGYCRVLKGGAFGNLYRSCRAACRDGLNPNQSTYSNASFRLCCPAEF